MTRTQPSDPCPTCGTPMVAGAAGSATCPRCLLGLGLDAGESAPEWVYTDGGRGGAEEPAPAPEDLAPFFPQLEILRCVGRGGMGFVYEARHRVLDRKVAVKLLSERFAGDGTFAERFEREARALARLAHPGIVTVYDSGRAAGMYYLVMELVLGANLRQLVAGGEVDTRAALEIVRQLCDALEYAHSQGVVHRDVKPENILVTTDGRVKVADFGLAKLVAVDGAEDSSAALTRTRQAMGTPHYVAPEQVERPREVDHRADIYSLGVVFYELLTGELPIGRFDPPSRRAEVDARLDRVVMKTLEKEPARRYQRASEVATDVQRVSTPAASDASQRIRDIAAGAHRAVDEVRRRAEGARERAGELRQRYHGAKGDARRAAKIAQREVLRAKNGAREARRRARASFFELTSKHRERRGGELMGGTPAALPVASEVASAPEAPCDPSPCVPCAPRGPRVRRAARRRARARTAHLGGMGFWAYAGGLVALAALLFLDELRLELARPAEVWLDPRILTAPRFALILSGTLAGFAALVRWGGRSAGDPRALPARFVGAAALVVLPWALLTGVAAESLAVQSLPGEAWVILTSARLRAFCMFAGLWSLVFLFSQRRRRSADRAAPRKARSGWGDGQLWRTVATLVAVWLFLDPSHGLHHAVPGWNGGSRWILFGALMLVVWWSPPLEGSAGADDEEPVET